MAKKPKKTEVEAVETAAPAEAKPRGLKGVAESALVSLLTPSNPKRAGSKSFDRFALYRDGMSCKEALDAGVTTPDLAWDTKHGFIAVEGYDVPGGVLAAKPAKEPKAPKAPKGKKAKAAPVDAAAASAADAEAQGESMD